MFIVKLHVLPSLVTEGGHKECGREISIYFNIVETTTAHILLYKMSHMINLLNLMH